MTGLAPLDAAQAAVEQAPLAAGAFLASPVESLGLDGGIVAMVHLALSSPAADAVLGYVSRSGAFAVPLLAILCASLAYRFRKDGLFTFAVALCLMGLADLCGNGLKHLFALPRPCLELKGVLDWIPDKCSGSNRGMPSNHAINYFTVATFFLFALGRGVRRRWPGVALLLVACLVALSRIYLGRHYPSQILAGASIGLLFGALGAFSFGRTALGRRIAGGSGSGPGRSPGKSGASPVPKVQSNPEPPA